VHFVPPEERDHRASTVVDHRRGNTANWGHAPNSSTPASSWPASRASFVQTGENTARESTEQFDLPGYGMSAASLPARPARRFARHARIM
jgi:hypothetical protein